MKRKKQILSGIGVILLIIFMSALLPKVIQAISNIFVQQIVAQKETETESESEEQGKLAVTMEGEEKPEPRAETEAEAAPEAGTELSREEAKKRNQEKEEQDAGLQAYRKLVEPEFTETYHGAIQEFIADRQEAFNQSLADYIYGLYGDSYRIHTVNVIEKVKEDSSELSYQIEVFVTGKEKEYSEQFISSYNKHWDFYSFYSYQQK